MRLSLVPSFLCHLVKSQTVKVSYIATKLPIASEILIIAKGHLFYRNVESINDMETSENQNYNIFQESLLEFTSNNT